MLGDIVLIVVARGVAVPVKKRNTLLPQIHAVAVDGRNKLAQQINKLPTIIISPHTVYAYYSGKQDSPQVLQSVRVLRGELPMRQQQFPAVGYLVVVICGGTTGRGHVIHNKVNTKKKCVDGFTIFMFRFVPTPLVLILPCFLVYSAFRLRRHHAVTTTKRAKLITYTDEFRESQTERWQISDMQN